MVTVGNKIDTFAQIVMNKLSEAFEAKREELDKQNEEAIKAYEHIAKEKAEQYVTEFEEEGKREAKILLSKAKTSVRNKHIETRQEIYKTFEKELREAIEAYVTSEDYLTYLKKVVEMAGKDLKRYTGITVDLSSFDSEHRRELIQTLLVEQGVDLEKIQFRKVEKGLLGGMIFYNQDNIIRMDYSLDAKLEENSRVLGILLSELLDEVGE